jgi:membrane protease YdiL (CAAX protease family)
MEHIKNTKLWEELSGELSVRDQLYVLVWLVPAAILAAGYPIRRSLRETLKRVGLVRPSRGQILLALGVTAALVLLGTGFDNGVAWLWQRLGWPQTDANAFNELIKFAVSPLGAVVVGVTAGVGEELAVRGVLQPRLGILLSNLFFTALHAFQYNFDALLSVFLLGLVLGCIRKYTNTTTSALIHGLYDFTLVLLAFLEVPGF